MANYKYSIGMKFVAKDKQTFNLGYSGLEIIGYNDRTSLDYIIQFEGQTTLIHYWNGL